MNMPLQMISCAVLLATAACAPFPDPEYAEQGSATAAMARSKPDWVDGTAGHYPDAQYLTGVGRGPDRLPCENDARAALAKVFEARIQQVSKDWQGYFSRVNAAGKVHVEAMAISQLTRVSTDYVLKGSHIVEIWQEPGAFHCLAALDRFSAATTLRDEIDRLDVQIATNVGEGDRAPNPTARFFAYKRAMELLQQREALNSELRIVDPRGAGKEPIHGWADLVAKFTAARTKIKIGLKLTGRDASKMQTCLAEQLTAHDVRVLENTSDIDVMVVGDLQWAWAGQVMGSYMVKINLNLRIIDAEGGQTVAAFAESLKAGRPQRDMAVQSASQKLCDQVAPRLAQKIQGALSR